MWYSQIVCYVFVLFWLPQITGAKNKINEYPRAREMLQSLLDRLRVSTHHPKRAHKKGPPPDALIGPSSISRVFAFVFQFW